MTRVSENSSSASLQFALNKAKSKMEKLQLKGSTLKDMTRPSDNSINNVEAMAIKSSTADNNQYNRNADFALTQLTVTEKALESLTEILSKAKEIAISQSSDFYGEDVRKNIANEVVQLRNQAIAIGNKRVGQRYIFAGFKTLNTPFKQDGVYQGDKGHTTLEVAKDFFVPINLNGHEVFYSTDDTQSKDPHPLVEFPDLESAPTIKNNSRDLASTTENEFVARDNIFSMLSNFAGALENNDPDVIQNLLEKFDDGISRLITLRTRVGSIMGSVETSIGTNESENIAQAERKSKLVDADIAELFSDITKQQALLKTTYKSSQGLLNSKLLDFLR
jgi:flagellar hook-associated protein 3 FlgL